MSYKAVTATSTTIGRSTIGEHKNYVYSGDKPLKAEPPRKVPNPKGGTPPDSTARKAERLARFEVILTELSGGDLKHAPPALVRKAGKLVGVGESTAKAYRAELIKQQRGENPR